MSSRSTPPGDLSCRCLLAQALFFFLLLPPAATAHEDPPPPPGPPMAARSHVHCEAGRAADFTCRGVDLLAFMPRADLGLGGTETLNDVWGWTDPQTGIDYAIVGLSNGTAFVSLADPERPVWLGTLPTRSFAATWRDVKVYRDHAFIVADVAAHGMQVFDLRQLRGRGGTGATFRATAEYAGPGLSAGGGFVLTSSHNVAIDTETGFAYAVGTTTCNAGLHVIDVREPARPRFAGCFGETGYVHDAQCVVYRGPDARFAGRELCFNANVGSLSVVDVTDKRDMRLVANVPYAGNQYAHQGWLTEDHRFFLLGDELDELRAGHRARTYVWDVRQVDAPRVIGVHEGTTSTDHNLYVRGNRVYEANYTTGLRILDASRVAEGRLSEVAFFDTFPESDETGFSGAWSVFPFFASGIVVVSGIGEGLFVLQPHEGGHHASGDGGAGPAVRRREVRERLRN